MPTNTNFDPRHVGDFDKLKMNFNAQGVKNTISLNTTTNIDLDFTDDHVVTGFWVLGSGVNLGDYIDIQVVDKNNMFGLGAGAVIKQFGTNLYMPATFDMNVDVAYPAKIYAGLTLRVVYHSTLLIGVAPYFAINWKVHKILV